MLLAGCLSEAGDHDKIGNTKWNCSARPCNGVGPRDPCKPDDLGEKDCCEGAHDKFHHSGHCGHQTFSESLKGIAVDKQQCEDAVARPVDHKIHLCEIHHLILTAAHKNAHQRFSREDDEQPAEQADGDRHHAALPHPFADAGEIARAVILCNISRHGDAKRHQRLDDQGVELLRRTAAP